MGSTLGGRLRDWTSPFRARRNRILLRNWCGGVQSVFEFGQIFEMDKAINLRGIELTSVFSVPELANRLTSFVCRTIGNNRLN